MVVRSDPTSRLSFVVPDPVAGKLEPGEHRDGRCIITLYRLGLVAIDGPRSAVLTHAFWLLSTWKVPGPVGGYLLCNGERERIADLTTGAANAAA